MPIRFGDQARKKKEDERKKLAKQARADKKERENKERLNKQYAEYLKNREFVSSPIIKINNAEQERERIEELAKKKAKEFSQKYKTTLLLKERGKNVIDNFTEQRIRKDQERIEKERIAEEKRIEEKQRLLKEQEQLEKERIAEQKRIEKERIAEEKRIEKERIEEEQRILKEQEQLEKELIAEQKRIEKERIEEKQRLLKEQERMKEIEQNKQLVVFRPPQSLPQQPRKNISTKRRKTLLQKIREVTMDIKSLKSI